MESSSLTVIQGSHHVARDEDLVLSTLLGSCVAACIWDEGARVGGMNHFLLPNARTDPGDTGGFSRGVHAMELLINDLLKAGGRRRNLEAKLFGGASINTGLTDIGEQNASFAERFLYHEGIALKGGSLRGTRGRRLQFWPMSGRARQSLIALISPRVAMPPLPVAADTGALELF